MTTLTGIELSKKVAELYGIEPDTYYDYWLHEDSARCFELMVEHGLTIERDYEVVYGPNVSGELFIGVRKDVNSLRTAILQCLVKMVQEHSDEQGSSSKKEGE